MADIVLNVFYMALLFIGKTPCALCGKVLMDGEDSTGLPPIADAQQPLYKYCDAGFHRQCFDTWDKKEEILALIKEHKKEQKQQFLASDDFEEMVAKYGRPKWLDDID